MIFKVLSNDVDAHEASVETLKTAGERMLEADCDAPEQLKQKLHAMNAGWKRLVDGLASKLAVLQRSKQEAESYGDQVEHWLGWLADVDEAVSGARPTGGMPDTAQQQLVDFQLLHAAIEESRPDIEQVIARGQPAASAHITALSNKWNMVQTKAQDRKVTIPTFQMS